MITFQTKIGQREIESLVNATRSTRSRLIELLLLSPLVIGLAYLTIPLSLLFESIIALVSSDVATGAEKIERLNEIPEFWWTVAILVCFGFPFIIWLFWKVVKDTRRLFDNSLVARDAYVKYKAALENVTYEVSENGIKSVSGDGETETFKWSDFVEAIRDNGLLFLVKAKPEQYVILPIQDVPSEEDRKRLTALIGAKLPNKKQAA